MAGRAARALARRGLQRATTSGVAPGLLQANLVILPAEHAETFATFCRANPQACPVLLQSEPGQTDAPPLAVNADIRTDVPVYRVYRYGELAAEIADISELWQDDLVCFYLGCSFSFESALAHRGVPVQNVLQGKNVPMYKTSVPCTPAGPFATELVVSMRPVPPALVPMAIETTAPLVQAHGAPVHCGDPAQLGIIDLSRPDYGDAIDIDLADVPLFWACGVTSSQAVVAARLPLCITHAPGAMFVTDLPETAPYPGPGGFTTPLVLPLTEAVIGGLETVIQHDLGQRGIASLHLPGELHRAASVLYDAAHVLVTTGFPCNISSIPPTETDGPPGAVALVDACLRLGKKVTVVIDPANHAVMEAALQACSRLRFTEEIRSRASRRDINCCYFLVAHPLLMWPNVSGAGVRLCIFEGPNAEIDNTVYLKTIDEILAREFDCPVDHVIAIERSGRAADGNFYSMRAVDMSSLCAPIDDIFVRATALQIASTGVGDGGNELGMGKVSALMTTKHK